jgi:hypothetical protein
MNVKNHSVLNQHAITPELHYANSKRRNRSLIHKKMKVEMNEQCLS